MPRLQKLADLDAIDARRAALRAELADLDDRAKAAEQAARDAGRSTLLGALDRVRIAELSKNDARSIAKASEQYGGKAVAAYLSTFQPMPA